MIYSCNECKEEWRLFNIEGVQTPCPQSDCIGCVYLVNDEGAHND